MWLECTKRDSKDSRKQTDIKNWQRLWLCWALLLRLRADDYLYPYVTQPWKKRCPEKPLGIVESRNICCFPGCFYLIIELGALVVVQHSSVGMCGQQRAPGLAIYALQTQMNSWIQRPATLNQLDKLNSRDHGNSVLFSCPAQRGRYKAPKMAALLKGNVNPPLMAWHQLHLNPWTPHRQQYSLPEMGENRSMSSNHPGLHQAWLQVTPRVVPRVTPQVTPQATSPGHSPLQTPSGSHTSSAGGRHRGGFCRQWRGNSILQLLGQAPPLQLQRPHSPSQKVL